MVWRTTCLITFFIAVQFATVRCDESTTVESDQFAIGKHKWNFADVRKGAHIFWWLHYTTATDVASPTEKPLAIWLQGGPGASSTAYGNFEEIGPFTIELKKRNFTWIEDMNVLFIDSPVGSGFSYVDHQQYLTTNNTQVAKDLVELTRQFLKESPEFKSVPIHIFGESYGGKVAVEYAYLLNREIKNKRIECNLKSVNSIDGWISPIDIMNSWPSYLYELGFVDKPGKRAIKRMVSNTRKAVNNGQYRLACDLFGHTELVVLEKAGAIDFYNVLRPVKIDAYNSKLRTLKDNMRSAIYKTLVDYDEDVRETILNSLMINSVTPALNITSGFAFGSQSEQTFYALSNEFMRPVTHIVEKLLNQTEIEVNIITGQLDLIVATPGTVKWVRNLNWSKAAAFSTSERKPFAVDSVLEGYYKKEGNLALYWVNRSGHMVPADNPDAMDWILEQITKNKEPTQNVISK